MKKKKISAVEKAVVILWVSIAVAVAAVVFAADIEVEDTPESITVLATSSLMEVMTELARDYSVKSGQSVIMTFDSSPLLAEQIIDGEPADIFITEDQGAMTQLKQKGVIDVFTLSNIAANRLALVASVNHYLSKYVRKEMALERLFSDVSDRVMLVMGDPEEVTVGMRAKEALIAINKWDVISPYIVRVENDSRARYLIAKGLNAGITYYTDAHEDPELEILVELPPSLYSPIVYQAGVVAGTNMQLARGFLDYLKSSRAKSAFSRYGFSVN